MGAKAKRIIFMTIVIGFAILWSIIQIYPLIFMFISGLKTTGDLLASPWKLPWPPQFQNWVGIWTGKGDWVGPVTIFSGLDRYFFNSMFVLVFSLVLINLLASMASFAFVRYNFLSKEAFYRFFLYVIIIPVHMVLIPLFILFNSVGLANNYIGIILVYSAFNLPFSVLILRTAFASLPKQVFEAAEIDGASEWTMFFRIGLPLIRPALGAISAVTGISIWGEFLFAFVLLSKEEMRTINVGLMSLRGSYSVDWGHFFAGLSIATIPFLIFYFVFQRQIMKGIALGAFR